MILYRGSAIKVEYTHDRIHFRVDSHSFHGPHLKFKTNEKVHDPKSVLTVEALWGIQPGDDRSVNFWKTVNHWKTVNQ